MLFVLGANGTGKSSLMLRFAQKNRQNARRVAALLHKLGDRQGSPFPGQTYPTSSVTGMPSAVKPLSNEPCRAIGPSDNGE